MVARSARSSPYLAHLSLSGCMSWPLALSVLSMKHAKLSKAVRFLTVGSFFLLLASSDGAQRKPEAGWPTYSNDPAGTRYSNASQIDRSNVSQLKVAWTYRTGALPHDEGLDKKAAFQATPILFDGKLLLSTPSEPMV